MPGLFSTFVNSISARAPYTSSTGHRNAQRLNAATEVISTGLQELSPAAIIPSKLAQTLVSGYSLFRADTHASEKTMHCLQAGLAMAQLGLAITMLFEGEQCAAFNSTQLCTGLFLCLLLYRGLLIAGMALGEFSKDPYEPAIDNTAQAHV